MKVLIVWGSKMGGTEEIAGFIAEELERASFTVTRSAAIAAPSPQGFDAVLIGGALYANRWHPEARRFVTDHLEELRGRPVWMFSSGPLDDTARQRAIPPPAQVAALMDRIGAVEHVTFGGRLSPERARHGTAAAMARRLSGDWRDPERIRAWARAVAQALPTAQPRPVIEPAARRLPRLVGYAAAAWLLGALLVRALPGSRSGVLAMLAVTLAGAAAAFFYFRPGRTREPLAAAFTFTVVEAALGLGGAALGLAGPSVMQALRAPLGFWLPLALVFVATWAVGAVLLSIPTSQPGATASAAP